jgi:oxygen-independent coproporphyrinogen-3 oxidase
VNRVSLGVQSFVDQEAQSVGRLHKRSTVLEEIGRLREAGLGNINIDLIAGLPHQSPESWAFSVSEAIATGVPHVSVYMLEVDEDSRLGSELIAGGARYHAHFVPDDDATADFYEQACEMLAAAGIAQYEISNFARVAPRNSELQNNESRHNLKYWTRQPYLGFGVDAHSMLEPLVWGQAPSPVQAEQSSAVAGGQRNPGFATAIDRIDADHPQAIRIATPDSLDAYMNREPHTVTPVSAQAAIEESFFLGLRLNRGIDLEQLRKELGADLLDCGETHECVDHRGRAALQGRVSHVKSGWALAPEASRSPQRAFKPVTIATWESAIQQGIQDGLLEQQGTTLRLTARGRLLSNEVFARFLTEEQKWEPVT